MVIEKMLFHVFADLFKAHADLVIGLAFTKSGEVTVMLNRVHYNWKVAMGISGLIMVWYSPMGETEWMKLGELNADDFKSITIR